MQWEAKHAGESRESVLNILPSMQKLYTDPWTDAFAWGQRVPLTSYPTGYAPSLLNGASLRTNVRTRTPVHARTHAQARTPCVRACVLEHLRARLLRSVGSHQS